MAEGLRAAGPGVPPDARTVRELLRAEGIRFDLHGHASPIQRLRPADWNLAGLT